jgi:c-di-GMP-related signal transduction protein
MAEPMTSAIHAVHVGRQPIYDGDGGLAGYELLFRGHSDAVGATSRGGYATSHVIVSAFTEFGLSRLVGKRLAFVNLTRDFLVGDLPMPFEPGQAVLEVLETVVVDDAVVAGVSALAARGYTIALDDYVAGSPAKRLLDHATYVKIDTLGVSEAELAETVRVCRDGRPGLRFVAERVETAEDVAVARRLGFDLFQGYAVGRPEVVSTSVLSASRLEAVRLLTLLQNPATPIAEVAARVVAAPPLSFRVLTAAGSAAAGTNRRVSSIQQAAVLVGTNRLREWATLMAVSDLTADEHELSAVLTHARFCHQIARLRGLEADAGFTAGLLDAVSDLLGVTPASLASRLPLADDLHAALVEDRGPLGEVLAIARAYRAASQWEPIPGDGAQDLAQAHLHAMAWAADLAG